MKKKINYIYLIIIALVFASSTYAIYRGGLSGLGSMSAASWSVTLNQTGVNDSLSIIPSPNETVASYTLNITSNSEVDVIYSIEVDNLPSGVSVSLDGGTYVPESNHKAILTSDKTILYSDSNKSKSHTLTFKASNNSLYVNNAEVDINVVARQQI